MNKKNKNKNKPKPINPNPSQSPLPEEKNVENVEEKPEIVLKSEERVPEIINEVVPQVEAKVSESDTPKKPKRNRGKKKKFDKEEETDSVQEQKASDPVYEVDIDSETKIQELQENRDEKSPEEMIVTPTARKKKNKNKKTVDIIEDPKSVEKEDNIISKDNVRTETADLKAKSLLPVSPENTDLETKSSKKKNKKKKRNDSEKSDKTDEAAACTAAFQKLLEQKGETKDVKMDANSEDLNLPSIKSNNTTEVIDKEGKVDDMPHVSVKRSENILKSESEGHSETNQNKFKEEQDKGKKKNKGEKINSPKLDTKELQNIVKPESNVEFGQIKTETEVENVTETEFVEDGGRSKKKNKKDKKHPPQPEIKKDLQQVLLPKTHIEIFQPETEKEIKTLPETEFTEDDKSDTSKIDKKYHPKPEMKEQLQETLVSKNNEPLSITAEKEVEIKFEIESKKDDEKSVNDDKKNKKCASKTDSELKETLKPDTLVESLQIQSEKESISLSESEFTESGKSKKKNKKDKKHPLKPDIEELVPLPLECQTVIGPHLIKTDKGGENLSDTETGIEFKDQSKKVKNKNKKDTKHLPSSESDEIAHKSEIITESVEIKTKSEVKCPSETKTEKEKNPVVTLTVTEKPSEDIKQLMQKELENLILGSPASKEEKSPKPKAMIARPVDKKRKEKSDLQIAEDFSKSDVSIENILSEEKALPIALESCSFKDTTKFIKERPTLTEDATEQIEKVKPIQDDLLKLEAKLEIKEALPIIQETERISTSDNNIVPKIKKSPRPSKKNENLVKAESIKSLKTDQITKPEETIEPIKLIDETIKSEIVTPAEVIQKEAEMKHETPGIKASDVFELKTDLPKSEDGIQSLASGTFIPDLTLQTETKEDPINVKQISKSEQKPELSKNEKMNIPDSGMGKKRKKSPKPPKRHDIKPDFKDSTDKDAEVNITKPAEVEKERKEKTESPSDLPSLEDIEIRSIRTDESEGSVSDFVPDIQYPRSSSQLDDNNNMIIKEVTPDLTEAVKLTIPVNTTDTHFVQGSGETPAIPTPECSQSSVKIVEVDSKHTKASEEKTDLKSKVMEVNKDMEDLRLSIEKSLAELTAMEKSDNIAERKLEETISKAEKELEIKYDTSEKKEEISEDKITVAKMKQPAEIIDSKRVTVKQQTKETKELSGPVDSPTPPVYPPRKDHKGKGKGKKKGKDSDQNVTTSTTSAQSGSSESGTTGSNDKSETSSQDAKKEGKTEQKTDNSQEKGKQQLNTLEEDKNTTVEPQNKNPSKTLEAFEPIESFEDAMTSSSDDINRTFEVIVHEANNNELSQNSQQGSSQNNPEISITAPTDDDEKDSRQEKINPVSQPKNLLGHPAIPVRLNKTDYKKEKNKTPNTKQAKVKIKDDVPIEANKRSKQSQTENKRFIIDRKSTNETITCMSNENEEYVYKYSFRKVFLQSACHICKKDLKQARVPCNFCNLVFYCSLKHKDEDYSQHQGLCFAISTIVHLKDQKHIYADIKNAAGHEFRLLRMQAIVSCEKVLKRKLVPWEQEALLYPRICAEVGCREWRQTKLRDCEGCGQISYCVDHPDHFPKSHQRWCNSYSLYQKLVCHQQTLGRLEPMLPSRVMTEVYNIPGRMNEVLATMFEEKIDMTDIQYAALTQIATAPLTAAFCYQLYNNKMNSTYANGIYKKSSFTIHVVGAELQFEADALNKWEVFFLHLRPDVKELRVVLVGPELNPSNLPLDLLGKVKLCEDCRQNKRRVIFDFQDKKNYYEYWSTDFITPDLVCAFNPSIQRSTIYNGKDTWPATIKCIMKLKIPFVVTSYTLNELQNDYRRIKECAEVEINIISEPNYNPFASVRPDRNFISDDEMPLLFKNYCSMVICGAF